MQRSFRSDLEIVHAARQVLLRRGVGATLDDVATAAGVAKGTVHKRFGSKDALFRAALTVQPPPWTRQLAAAVGRGDVRDNLAGLFVEMVRWSERVAPLVVLRWSSPALAEELEVLRGERELATYLADEMMGGRLRCIDPRACARMLVATAWDHALLGGSLAAASRLEPIWRGLELDPAEVEPPSSNGPRPTWPPTGPRQRFAWEPGEELVDGLREEPADGDDDVPTPRVAWMWGVQ